MLTTGTKIFQQVINATAKSSLASRMLRSVVNPLEKHVVLQNSSSTNSHYGSLQLKSSYSSALPVLAHPTSTFKGLTEGDITPSAPKFSISYVLHSRDFRGPKKVIQTFSNSYEADQALQQLESGSKQRFYWIEQHTNFEYGN